MHQALATDAVKLKSFRLWCVQRVLSQRMLAVPYIPYIDSSSQVKYFEFPRLNKRRVLLKHNISQSVSSSPDKNLDSVHLEAATSPVTTRPRHHATDSKIGFSHNLGYLSHYTVPVDTQNFVRHEVAPRIGCYCLPRL
jgi:hypothetical protein